MKTNQTIKSNQTMKSNLTIKTNKLMKLIPVLGIMALCTTQVKAQTTDAADALLVKGSNVVKVVDNKGTIKYFQSKNGITQITSTTAGSATTTTWQLGGTLTDDTYIDVDGKVFVLNGLALETGTASTDATSGTDAGAGTGYALLVRDEATGETRKMLASSLINGGVGTHEVAADVASASTLTTVAFTGLTNIQNRVSVFRNGIKLLQSDWVFNSTDATKIDITASASLPIYEDDIIEVQWVK